MLHLSPFRIHFAIAARKNIHLTRTHAIASSVRWLFVQNVGVKQGLFQKVNLKFEAKYAKSVIASFS